MGFLTKSIGLSCEIELFSVAHTPILRLAILPCRVVTFKTRFVLHMFKTRFKHGLKHNHFQSLKHISLFQLTNYDRNYQILMENIHEGLSDLAKRFEKLALSSARFQCLFSTMQLIPNDPRNNLGLEKLQKIASGNQMLRTD